MAILFVSSRSACDGWMFPLAWLWQMIIEVGLVFRTNWKISFALTTVMRKFEDSEAWNLPVVDNQRYVGFISKSRMFSAYREKLVEFSDRK